MHRRTLTISLLALVALLALAAFAQASSNKSAVNKAARWMRSTSLTQFPGTGFRADAVVALTAAHAPSGAKKKLIDSVSDDALDYSSGSGAAAKVALAAVAAGRNPRCFGPTGSKADFFGLIRSEYNVKSGKLGDTAFEQALVLLAYKAMHERVPRKSVQYALNARGKHGWNFAMSRSAGDDVESTALMIQALRAVGVSKKSKSLRQAYKWMKLQANTYGGYNPAPAANNVPTGETQADTTAYAIEAAAAMGVNNKKAKTALRALQEKQGYFRSSPGTEGDYHGIATSDAVIALSGAHLPVRSLRKSQQSCG